MEFILEAEELYKDPELNEISLSRALATNRTYLAEIFKRTVGLHFRDYLNIYRLMKAREILINKKHENMSLIAISEEVGFRNYGTFNEAFKKYYGITPGEWRNKYRKSVSQTKKTI